MRTSTSLPLHQTERNSHLYFSSLHFLFPVANTGLRTDIKTRRERGQRINFATSKKIMDIGFRLEMMTGKLNKTGKVRIT